MNLMVRGGWTFDSVPCETKTFAKMTYSNPLTEGRGWGQRSFGSIEENLFTGSVSLDDDQWCDGKKVGEDLPGGVYGFTSRPGACSGPYHRRPDQGSPQQASPMDWGPAWW